jgi:hypothetical protein
VINPDQLPLMNLGIVVLEMERKGRVRKNIVLKD